MLRLSRINDVVNLLYTESNNLEVYLKKKSLLDKIFTGLADLR